MNIKGYELNKTCAACPEQYDVTKDGEQVGYLKLRSGYFSAEYPDVCGQEVYSAKPEGNGVFEEHERLYFLTKAINAIDNKIMRMEGEKAILNNTAATGALRNGYGEIVG